VLWFLTKEKYMQANVHTPERLQGETMAQYRERRAASAAANHNNTNIGFGGENSRTSMRNAQRQSGAMKNIAGAYGRGLRNWINRTQAAARA
jgi:hypothetical protein